MRYLGGTGVRLVRANAHMFGNGVISNDADRFKRFYVLFFLSTNAPSPRHADRVSVATLFHLCHPNSLGPFCFIDSVLPTKHLFGHDRP